MAITYIGSTLSIARDVPATENQAGFEALHYSEVGKVISIGELGDTSEDVAFDLLKSGRKTHVNGIKDIGEIAVTVSFDDVDSGQALAESASNTNESHSIRILDEDGDAQYFFGVLANWGISERTASNYKGAMFMVRGQSALVEVIA